MENFRHPEMLVTSGHNQFTASANAAASVGGANVGDQGIDR
jgi:hypothetical protein